MPTISADHLTVLNVFTTDSADNQERLIGAMREVVDNATYEGWISSTVHSGRESFGTANFIQWRSGEDLDARYAGEEFQHRTLPLFREITTSIQLLQTELAHSHRAVELGEHTEIGPERGEHTVIEIFGVTDDDREALVDALGPGQHWLAEVPGYRAHTVLRGLRARGVEGAFVVVYSQWAAGADHDRLRAQPAEDRSAGRRDSESRIDALATWRQWNSYQIVLTRSADQPPGVVTTAPASSPTRA